MSLIYSFILYPLLWLGFWLLSLRDPKVRKGFELRKGKAWLRPFATGTRWIWFHVASGELEYAKPVIRELKKPGVLPADVKILVTFFSPSVLPALERTSDVDLFVPMPWDTRRHWKEFLAHYSPLCLAIARTDTWPNMIWETHKKNIPSLLFSATLPRQSARVASFWGRLFYGSIVDDLSRVSCVTSDDADHFRRLSDEIEIAVEGDTRFDQVISRVAENRPVSPALEKSLKCLVAGSTWPEDENVLLPALVKPTSEGLKVILAPHEPTPAHLRHLEETCTALHMRTRRYSALDGNPHSSDVAPSIILIDRVGILADLYRLAPMAFVGGSFKKSVHSVMEPAASGCLTFVGPFHANSREALALKSRGFVREIQSSPHDLQEILLREMSKEPREIAGRKQAIIDFVESNKGVSVKIAQWIKARV